MAEVQERIETIKKVDSPLVAIGFNGNAPHQIMASVNSLVVVQNDGELGPSSRLLHGERLTTSHLNEAYDLRDDGYITLLESPVGIGGSECALVVVPKHLTIGEMPASCKQTRVEGNPDYLVYIDDVHTLTAVMAGWAQNQLLPHAQQCVSEGDTALARELAFGAFAMTHGNAELRGAAKKLLVDLGLGEEFLQD